MANGKVSVPFGRCLGYDRGEHGELIVNKKEAAVVREIYKLFLSGLTPHGIAKELTNRSIPIEPDCETRFDSEKRNHR